MAILYLKIARTLLRLDFIFHFGALQKTHTHTRHTRSDGEGASYSKFYGQFQQIHISLWSQVVCMHGPNFILCRHEQENGSNISSSSTKSERKECGVLIGKIRKTHSAPSNKENKNKERTRVQTLWTCKYAIKNTLFFLMYVKYTCLTQSVKHL